MKNLQNIGESDDRRWHLINKRYIYSNTTQPTELVAANSSGRGEAFHLNKFKEEPLGKSVAADLFKGSKTKLNNKYK